jgi:hypothetical protein
MTEITNPLPSDPGGASAQEQESVPPSGAESLLDGGSTGTDDGPGGIPAALVGRDKAGDEVDAPRAATSGADIPDYASAEDDALSPADTGSPQANSAGRGESASSGQSFSGGR